MFDDDLGGGVFADRFASVNGQARVRAGEWARSCPVLIISAENASARCWAASATGFIEKPSDAVSLFRTIQEIKEVGLSED